MGKWSLKGTNTNRTTMKSLPGPFLPQLIQLFHDAITTAEVI